LGKNIHFKRWVLSFQDQIYQTAGFCSLHPPPTITNKNPSSIHRTTDAVTRVSAAANTTSQMQKKEGYNTMAKKNHFEN